MAQRGINKVILIGNLGNTPEVRKLESGKKVTDFRLATSETWINKQGNKETDTQWHTIVAWDKLAETCGEHLEKGRKIYVEGRLRTREIEKDNETRRFTEVIANQIVMLDSMYGSGNKKEENGKPII